MGVKVNDPFNAAKDPHLPSLALALDPVIARRELKRGLPRLSGEGTLRLKKITVIRHKPGKRCVLEYVVLVEGPGKEPDRVTLVGKVRARRSGNEGFRLQQAFWNAGFDDRSEDHIFVPEPIGVIADFRMWFQRKVRAIEGEDALGGPDGVPLAERLATAIHKVHMAGVPTERRHEMSDELRILRECFGQVASVRPNWSARLDRLMDACEALGSTVAPARLCGIHRDFYASQVLVKGNKLWLLDFDLYCQGDPGLDVGNFIGHLTELALRQSGNPGAVSHVARALEDRFVALSGEGVRHSVRAYADLTLSRHIFLSLRFPDRGHLAEPLLALCERRLQAYCTRTR